MNYSKVLPIKTIENINKILSSFTKSLSKLTNSYNNNKQTDKSKIKGSKNNKYWNKNKLPVKS